LLSLKSKASRDVEPQDNAGKDGVPCKINAGIDDVPQANS